MARMIEEGFIGNKVEKGGFYQPADVARGVSRKTLDFDTFTYRDFDPARPQVAIDAELAGDFTLLLEDDGKYGQLRLGDSRQHLVLCGGTRP